MTLNYLSVQIRIYLPNHLHNKHSSLNPRAFPLPRMSSLSRPFFSGNSHPSFPFSLVTASSRKTSLTYIGWVPLLHSQRTPYLSYTVLPYWIVSACSLPTDFYYSLWHLYATQNVLNAPVKCEIHPFLL